MTDKFLNNVEKEIDKEISRLIIDQTNSLVITDKNCSYTYCNKAWEKLMKLNFNDVKGLKVKEIVPETKIDLALEKGISLSGKVKIGEKIAYSLYFPIRNDLNEIIAGTILTLMTGDNKLDYLNNIKKLTTKIQYKSPNVVKSSNTKYSLDDIVGSSKSIMKVKEHIKLAAKFSSTVLIQGETGCGKELVAHSIHNLSSRSSNPFIRVNCSAIPVNLMESTFFGYEEGSFTGAKNTGHVGKFELAKKGTVFLDEISELPLELQPKLLRTLQEKEIERIGGMKRIQIDSRIITSSNKSLKKLVDDGSFRKDLFYRLNVVIINVPPLRERIEDIYCITDNLVDRFNNSLGLNIPYLSLDIKKRLGHYHWPGNIRQLENTIENAIVMSNGNEIEWKHFQDHLNKPEPLISIEIDALEKNDLLKSTMKQIEKKIILQVLKQMGNNKSQTATKLGISRTMLYKKIKQYDIKC